MNYNFFNFPIFPFDEYMSEGDDEDPEENGFINYVKKRWAEEADA
jgi:hypothetical protein